MKFLAILVSTITVLLAVALLADARGPCAGRACAMPNSVQPATPAWTPAWKHGPVWDEKAGDSIVKAGNGYYLNSTVTAEVRRPVASATRAVAAKAGKAVVRVAAAPAKAVGRVAVAIHNRDRKPAVKAVASVGRGLGRLLCHLRPRGRG